VNATDASVLETLARGIAATAPRPLRVGGAASKRPRAPEPDALAVDLTAASGIVAYDPAECVVTARGGTPLSTLVETLAAHGQYLPWDPPLVEAGATIGGTVATGLSGPGRLRYGGVRDFIIGARVIDGRGRLITTGGQVVKNAAGFLLHHALVGSAGRLGVIGDISLKVFPRPEATCTLVAQAATRAGLLAVAERLRLANLDLDALDVDVAGRRVLARLAGAASALPSRRDRAALTAGVSTDEVRGAEQDALWQAHAAATWPADAAATVIKVPLTPSRVTALAEALAPHGAIVVSAAGSVLYLRPTGTTTDVDAALRAAGAAGIAVRGMETGRLLGVTASQAFHDRVRAALDPDGRFC